MGKNPDSGEFEVASAKLPESTRVEAQPMHGKWPAGERGSSSSLLKNASQRAADTPPKKSLAIRLRLGGTGKKYASDALKNNQLALSSPLHRAARPVGSLSESRRTSDNSDEIEDEGQRKSPLGPLDTSMIVRKPRSNMRREPAKHLRAAAALIGVKKPQVKRKPLPSPRKPAATGAERAPVRDETDFLYILAEAGESLERACAGNVEQPCVRKSKPSKSATQPSWKDRAKQSEAAKDAQASAPEREQSDSVKAPRSGEDENTELEKKGFKFRMKQKVRQNPPTVPEAEAGDDGTTPCSDTDAKPSDDEQRLGTQLVRTGSAGLRRPDSKPTRLQPSSGRPNGLVQRLLEKAGVQTNDAKFKSGPANFNGNTSQQRRPHAVEAPTTSSRPGGERALSPVDEHSDIPLNVLAKLVDAKPSPKPSKLQNSPRMEVLPRESPRPPPSPTGTNTDQESDDADSTDDEDNVADDHSHDSGIDEHELGMKRSRLPGEEGDAKKQRRIEANREAARQTIRRKRAHYEDMLAKEKELEQENSMLYMAIERARHDIELLQNNITWLQNLLDKANVEDHEGRLRIQRSLRSEQSRLEEQRCIMNARRAEELRRQEMEKKRMKEDKIRAHEEGGHLKESRGGQEQGDSEDEEEHAQEGRHRMAGDERAGARHSEDRRRPSADPRRPPNYRDLGPGGPGSNGWPMPRPGGPWMKGPGGMSPSSGPGSFPPEMAAMFAAGMPPGMMPPPGAFPGLPPGMMPPGMPTPEQMQMFSQAGGPPPPWFNIPPGAMQQQQHEMMAANEAAMHAIASGAVPDMGGMMPHGMELPPGLRGMPPEIAARMMAGFPPLPGMMPPYGMDPKQGSRPPFYGKP